MDAEPGPQTTLLEALEQSGVAAIGDPGLRSIQKSGEDDHPVDIDLCLLLLFVHYVD